MKLSLHETGKPPSSNFLDGLAEEADVGLQNHETRLDLDLLLGRFVFCNFQIFAAVATVSLLTGRRQGRCPVT